MCKYIYKTYHRIIVKNEWKINKILGKIVTRDT